MAADGDRPNRAAPSGTQCRQHPDRPALATCPECGNHVCIECWHNAIDRCHTCVQHDPASAAPPIPWEDQESEAAWPRRALDTMFSALRPVRTSPAFARGEVGPAVRFALLVFVPMGLLRGIIPYTHTLRFGPTFGLTTIGSPSSAAIAADVVRAMGMGLGTTLIVWLALTLPYVSLTRAYGEGRARTSSALRLMLYRSWLVAISSQWYYMQGLLFGVLAWAMPPEPDPTMLLFVLTLDQILPLMLLLVAMRSTARICGGVGPLASFLVVLVPLALLVLVEGTMGSVLGPWMETGQAAAEAAREAAGG